jgi:O-antigen ligase
MPEHLRALVVILILAASVFAVVRAASAKLIEPANFRHWRNLWFVVTLAAFLTHDFWIYVVTAGLLVASFLKSERNAVAPFFLLLFAVPPAGAQIPGLGMINYLFELHHIRLLELVMLVPVLLRLWGREDTLSFGRTTPDRLIVLYALLLMSLQFRETSLTDTLRQGFYLFTDMLLPYYVISRGLRNLQDFRAAMTAFVLAAAVLAVVGLFEFARHWLLYKALIDALGLDWGYLKYLGRAGDLRATASTGHPIALGYVLVVAIGFFLFLRERIPNALHRGSGLVVLAGGLVSALSRGPWVGSAILAVVFLGTGRSRIRGLVFAGAAGFFILGLLTALPGGGRIIALLPWIGTVEVENIAYREKLIESAWTVIKRNPWLGSVNFLQAPEMEELRQGQDIIDVVNTYLGVTLHSGLIGLVLFAGFFASVLLGMRRSLRVMKEKTSEEHLLGRALLATLAAVLFIIATTSSISVIPIVYWSLAAMGVAYAELTREQTAQRVNDTSNSVRELEDPHFPGKCPRWTWSRAFSL